MKYTTKLKQYQIVGGVKIEPKGGELSEEQKKAIIADPYGKDLIEKKCLIIEGLKPEELVAPQVKKRGMSARQVKKPDAPAPSGPPKPSGHAGSEKPPAPGDPSKPGDPAKPGESGKGDPGK